MAKPRVFATTIHAFSDTLRAARAMPLLIAVAVAASFGHDLLSSFTPRENEPGGLLASLVFGFAWAILMAPVFIGIFRFIILGEVTPDYPLDLRSPRVRAFCAWSVALSLVIQVLTGLVKTYWEDDQRLIVITASAIAIVGTALIFPAVAVDAPGATLRNAIVDVRGSFWRALTILALTFLPFLLVGLVVLVVIAFALALSDADTSTRANVISAIVYPIWSFAMFCDELVWTAASARLFLSLADRLHRPRSL